jgi:ribonuclease BN (tRNA processing enzyme)
MKLTVLGSGSLISGPERAMSGFVLQFSGQAIAIDLGTGCFKNMQRAGVDYSKISNLFFTHFEHPDHIADLVGFLFARKGLVDLGVSKPTQMNLFGGPGFAGFMKRLFLAFPLFENMPFRVTVSELAGVSSRKFPGFLLKTRPMKHAASSIGFRFEAGGKSVAFSGDTEFNDNLASLAENAGLLVADCNYAEQPPKWGHMNAMVAAKAASVAKAKALLLSHFLPETAKANLKALAAVNFSGKILVAKDLMEVTV